MKKRDKTIRTPGNKKDVLDLKKCPKPIIKKILFGATLITVILAPYAVGLCKGN